VLRGIHTAHADGEVGSGKAQEQGRFGGPGSPRWQIESNWEDLGGGEEAQLREAQKMSADVIFQLIRAHL
jgi:hypothetical protein